MRALHWSLISMLALASPALAQEAKPSAKEQKGLAAAEYTVAALAAGAYLQGAQAGTIALTGLKIRAIQTMPTRESMLRQADRNLQAARDARAEAIWFRDAAGAIAADGRVHEVSPAQLQRTAEGLEARALRHTTEADFNQMQARAVGRTDAWVARQVSDEVKKLRPVVGKGADYGTSRKGAATAALAAVALYDAVKRTTQGPDAGWSPAVSLVKKKVDAGVSAYQTTANWLWEKFTVPVDATSVAGKDGK